MRINPTLARSMPLLLLGLVVAYGALLRLDAISGQFDPVPAPRWLHRLELARSGPSRLRPRDMHWDASPRFDHKDGPPTQYRSDPYTYLQYAREMRSFYAAHRREPVFPLATKVSLWLLHDSDSAVSFASAAFSVLAIALTFLLGREACSPWVGLTAAALWAIEFQVVTSAAEGWRDDAFTCVVLLTAWLALRLERHATAGNAIALGAAGGLACLVRITSLSFLVPVFLWIVLTGRATRPFRARAVSIAALAALVVAGPYLFNCWRAFGDPLYAINVHADVYRATEAETGPVSESARAYLTGHLRSRPIGTIETLALGMTTYPFENKWAGFDVWLTPLGAVLAVAALAGLFLFLGFAAGRLLLVVLVASLVPYAATWRLIADWRFTEHAYPFLLIAACSVPWLAGQAFAARAELAADRRRVRGALAIWGVAALVAVAGWIALTRFTPSRVFVETVDAGEPATIMAGSRDASFFTGEWPQVVRTGTVATRVATGSRATIVVPLPAAARDYDALLRVDPSTEPLRAGMTPSPIQILFNGRLIGTCDPGSSPERMGICRLVLPAGDVRPGANRLTLVTGQPSGFRLWYLRITRSRPS